MHVTLSVKLWQTTVSKKKKKRQGEKERKKITDPLWFPELYQEWPPQNSKSTSKYSEYFLCPSLSCQMPFLSGNIVHNLLCLPFLGPLHALCVSLWHMLCDVYLCMCAVLWHCVCVCVIAYVCVCGVCLMHCMVVYVCDVSVLWCDVWICMCVPLCMCIYVRGMCVYVWL